MSEHYYTKDPVSAHDERTIHVRALGTEAVFTTDAGVFSRDDLDDGTRILLEALPELNGRVLDLGCGWGPVGVLLKKTRPALDIVMTDVNSRAVSLAERNLKANGARAEVVQGDGYENVTGKFTAVITNPPIRAGKAAIYGFFHDAKEHLEPDGRLFIVIRKQQGAPSALKFLKEEYASAKVISREKGFWVIEAGLTEADDE